MSYQRSMPILWRRRCMVALLGAGMGLSLGASLGGAAFAQTHRDHPADVPPEPIPAPTMQAQSLTPPRKGMAITPPHDVDPGIHAPLPQGVTHSTPVIPPPETAVRHSVPLSTQGSEVQQKGSEIPMNGAH